MAAVRGDGLSFMTRLRMNTPGRDYANFLSGLLDYSSRPRELVAASEQASYMLAFGHDELPAMMRSSIVRQNRKDDSYKGAQIHSGRGRH